MIRLYKQLNVQHEAGLSKWSELKRKVNNFFKDLPYYIDFVIARFLVWRELRSERKRAKSKDLEE